MNGTFVRFTEGPAIVLLQDSEEKTWPVDEGCKVTVDGQPEPKGWSPKRGDRFELSGRPATSAVVTTAK